MTKVTDELIDSMYDAITTTSLFAGRLSDGDVHNSEASEMSWLLGSMRRRLEAALIVLEQIQTEQRRTHPEECHSLIELSDQIQALQAKFERRRRDVKDAAE
jgi:hypothetical protein